MDLNAFTLLEKKIEELLGRLERPQRGKQPSCAAGCRKKTIKLAEMDQRLAEGETERDQVRARVEQLLAKLETL